MGLLPIDIGTGLGRMWKGVEPMFLLPEQEKQQETKETLIHIICLLAG